MSEIPKDVIVKAAAAYDATLGRWHSPEADARLGPMENALLAVLPDLQQPQPGKMHEIDRAFYDLAIKERDYERQRADRLAAERDDRPDLTPEELAICRRGLNHYITPAAQSAWEKLAALLEARR